MINSKKIEIINKMQQFLIENARQVYRSYNLGSFDVFIHEKESLSFLNYSIPTSAESKCFSKEYIEILKLFDLNKRKVRFEFLEEFAPQLSTQLLAVGLKEEYRVDFMICTRDSFTEPSSIDGYVISSLNSSSAGDKLKNFKVIQEISFNGNSNIQSNLIDEKDVILSIGGGIGFIGCKNDISVSACQYTTIIDGITELVGIATLPQYRCKGFGAAISARATEVAFENGASIVCLSAADANASKIYASIGFAKIGTMLAYC